MFSKQVRKMSEFMSYTDMCDWIRSEAADIPRSTLLEAWEAYQYRMANPKEGKLGGHTLDYILTVKGKRKERRLYVEKKFTEVKSGKEEGGKEGSSQESDAQEDRDAE